MSLFGLRELRDEIRLNRESYERLVHESAEHYEQLRRESEEFHAQLRQQSDDQITLLRETVRRNEIAFQENSQVLAGLVRQVSELVEVTKAVRDGMFSLIDRLDERFPPPEAA